MEGKINVKFTGTGLKAVITGLDRCRDAQDEAAHTLKWRINNLITTGSRSGRRARGRPCRGSGSCAGRPS